MADDSKLHFVMFPWLAFGHIIPFLELSKFLAQKGHKISFISSPRNIDRLPKIPTNLPIKLVKIPLPPIEELPENAEATMDVRTDDIHYLKKAYDGLESGLTRFLESESPDWIVMDFAPHWLPPIAAKLGISRVFFSIINAWFLVFLGASSEAMINGSDERTAPEDFTVPPKWVPFPTKAAYKLYEANWAFQSTKLNASGFTDMYRCGSVIQGIDAILVRHCNEFEPEWLTLLENLHGRRVIPVGLMPPRRQNNQDDTNETWVSIRDWLDSQNRCSVVYVALGSEVALSQEQLSELALGLELSGLPFFWALRIPRSNPVDLPDGFEERMKSKRQGMVWKAWVPQVKILSHDSVGGFLTHCGWSSIIEGLMFGKPLIMLPFLVDQGLNARLLAAKEAGVEVDRDEESGAFTKETVAEALRLVMVESERGKVLNRGKAKEMGVVFGDKDLHDLYLENLVVYFENHRRLCKES